MHWSPADAKAVYRPYTRCRLEDKSSCTEVVGLLDGMIKPWWVAGYFVFNTIMQDSWHWSYSLIIFNLPQRFKPEMICEREKEKRGGERRRDANALARLLTRRQSNLIWITTFLTHYATLFLSLLWLILCWYRCLFAAFWYFASVLLHSYCLSTSSTKSVRSRDERCDNAHNDLNVWFFFNRNQ